MKIAIHPDSWICLCGNNRGMTTFVPCSIEGVPIPLQCRSCLSKPKYYRCSQCGRVVNANTLEVVSSTWSWGLHWLGSRLLPQWSMRSSYRCQHA